MSTNDKNTTRKAFLLNFNNDIERRIIYSTVDFQKKDILQKKIATINEEVNFCIHNLNILEENRNIAYIKVQPLFSQNHFDPLRPGIRIVMDSGVNQEAYDELLRGEISEGKANSSLNISHLIDIFIADGGRDFVISNIDCDMRLIVDGHLLPKAIIDILLDISMFNSFSFLKAMPLLERKKFNKKKIEFCRDKELHFYQRNERDAFEYFSIAFLARNDDGDFDLNLYLELWNKFIKQFYPNQKHIVPSVREQFSHYVDLGELAEARIREAEKMEKGTYLLLRTNKDRTSLIRPQIANEFGISPKKPYRIGLVKIVPISQYYKILPMLRNLDVSAFKFIVP